MYDTLKAAIINRLPDNTTGIITPLAMRTNFTEAIIVLGDNSNFLGYAPTANPTATPDGKCWYITNPNDTSVLAKTYTGYGSNITVRVGQQYIFWWNGSTWNKTIIERDFQNANYGSTRGNGASGFVSKIDTLLGFPSLDTPYSGTPRSVRVLNNSSAVSYVMRMTVDGVDIEPSDYVEFDDNDAHNVSIIFDQTYRVSNPSCLDGIAAETIGLPCGMTTFDTPVGATTTAVVLPPTVTYIDAAAITSTAASTLALTGAPPTLDSQIDWSNINTLSIPNQYAILYQRADWQTAIAAVVAAGGTVVTDGGTAYDPTANTFKTKQTAVVDPTASGSTSAFIDSISQDANGVITVTKKNVKAEDTKVTQAQIDNTLADSIPLILKNDKNITTTTDTVSFDKSLNYIPKKNELHASFFVGDGSQLTGVPVSSHTHGNIQNDGTLQTNDVTIATGDKLVVTDKSDSAKVARASLSFDTSNTSDYLRKDGKWATPSGGGGSSMPAVDYHAYSANTQAIEFASTHSYHTVSVSGSTQTFNISIPSANTFVNYLLVRNTGSSACTVALAAASGMTWTSFVLPTDAIEVAAGECVELSFISINSHTQLIVTKSAAMEETSLT